jgi:citrate lyase subunit beta/citryl-CoA lyase
MKAARHPIRSWLFVPGDSERKLAKAAGSGADCVILDLEDSVAAERKGFARGHAADVAAAWPAHEGAPQLFVRLNSQSSVWHMEDVAAAAARGVAGVVLPKAEGGPDVTRLDAALRVAEAEAGLADGALAILAIATETPRAVLEIASYPAGAPRLCGLAWGGEDLGAALGTLAARDADGRHTPPFAHARTMLLFGAAAAGVAAIDGIVADVRDETLLRRDCGEAVRDGFAGKLAIHPAQVAIINDAFTPSADDIAQARAVLAAFEATPGAGVVSLDGRMLDRPHRLAAERLLARAGRLPL